MFGLCGRFYQTRSILLGCVLGLLKGVHSLLCWLLGRWLSACCCYCYRHYHRTPPPHNDRSEPEPATTYTSSKRNSSSTTTSTTTTLPLPLLIPPSPTAQLLPPPLPPPPTLPTCCQHHHCHYNLTWNTFTTRSLLETHAAGHAELSREVGVDDGASWCQQACLHCPCHTALPAACLPTPIQNKCRHMPTLVSSVNSATFWLALPGLGHQGVRREDQRHRGLGHQRAGTPRARTPKTGIPRAGAPRAATPRAGTPKTGAPGFGHQGLDMWRKQGRSRRCERDQQQGKANNLDNTIEEMTSPMQVRAIQSVSPLHALSMPHQACSPRTG